MVVEVTVEVERVIDGDTFQGTRRIYFPDLDKEERYFNQRFRLIGIDTPERNEPLYLEAKNFTKQMIEGKEVNIKVYGKDAFGRFLCKVFVNGECLNDMLLEKGLAEPYERKKEKVS